MINKFACQIAKDQIYTTIYIIYNPKPFIYSKISIQYDKTHGGERDEMQEV